MLTWLQVHSSHLSAPKTLSNDIKFVSCQFKESTKSLKQIGDQETSSCFTKSEKKVRTQLYPPSTTSTTPYFAPIGTESTLSTMLQTCTNKKSVLNYKTSNARSQAVLRQRRHNCHNSLSRFAVQLL